MRKSYIQIGGKLYDKSTLVHQDPAYTATIQSDVPDFISPIDGTVVSGRAGLRDHCARHNVVLTEDLKGLPMKPLYSDHVPEQHREETRQVMADIINSRGYFRRK